MKFKKILGLALSAAMAVSAVVPWTGVTAFAAEEGTDTAGSDAGISTNSIGPVGVPTDSQAKSAIKRAGLDVIVKCENHGKVRLPLNDFDIVDIEYGGPINNYWVTFEINTSDYVKDGEGYTHSAADTVITKTVLLDWGVAFGGWHVESCGSDIVINVECEPTEPEEIEVAVEHYSLDKTLLKTTTETITDIDDVDVDSWKIEIEGYTYIYGDFDPLTKTAKLVYQADEITPPVGEVYTVTFAANPAEAATITTSSIQIRAGGTIPTEPSVTYDETKYEFAGYTINGETVADLLSYKVESDVTVVLNFVEKTEVPEQGEAIDKIVVIAGENLQAKIKTVCTLTAKYGDGDSDLTVLVETNNMDPEFIYRTNSASEIPEELTTENYQNFYTDFIFRGWPTYVTMTTCDLDDVQKTYIEKEDGKNVLYIELEIGSSETPVVRDVTVQYYHESALDFEIAAPVVLEGIAEGTVIDQAYLEEAGQLIPETVALLGYEVKEVQPEENGVVKVIFKDAEAAETYSVKHVFAEGTPDGVTFADGSSIILDTYEENYVRIPAQGVKDGYVIDKVEVYKGDVLFTTYTGNYDYMYTYLSDAPVTLVYYVSETPVDPTPDPDPDPDPEEPDDNTDDTNDPYIPTRPGGGDEDIDDPDTPTTDLPGDETIDDGETPLAPGDAVPGTPGDAVPGTPGDVSGEEIGDETVPQTNAPPQTGVKVAGSLGLLAGAAVVAALTLKKRKDD